MNILLGIIIGLIILMLLVVAHEFGHFIMARKNGVRVLEFGIGFPPRAIAWVRNPSWQKGKKGVKKWVRLPKSEWNKPQKHMVSALTGYLLAVFAPWMANPTPTPVKALLVLLVFGVKPKSYLAAC